MTPFSRWERELPKLIMEPRFSVVATLKERRQLFDRFCRTSAETHTKARADRERAVRDAFSALLAEAASSELPPTGVHVSA